MSTHTKTNKVLDKAASSRKTVKFKIANRKLKRAGLPTFSFKGTVVSPTKICLQFEGVESKLRVMEGAEYIKMPDLSAGYTIKHTGSPVDVLAVGCQMPTLSFRHALKARTERALGMRRLRELEDLSHLLGIKSGPRATGRKPN